MQLLHLYLKCHSSTGVLAHFASKNQLPGLSVSRTWVGNELTIISELLNSGFLFSFFIIL